MDVPALSFCGFRGGRFPPPASALLCYDYPAFMSAAGGSGANAAPDSDAPRRCFEDEH